MEQVLKKEADTTKLKISDGSLLDVSSKDYPNLYSLIKDYPSCLSISKSNNKTIVSIKDLVNNQKEESYILVNRSNEKLASALEDLIKIRIEGNIPPTIGTKNLSLNFSVLPSEDKDLFNLLNTAKDINFQLVVESEKQNKITWGLRNTSSYSYELINNNYTKVTNKTELKFDLPADHSKLSLVDGKTLSNALNSAIEKDNQEASENKVGGSAANKPNNRKTQFLTRLKTESLLNTLREQEDVFGIIQKATGTIKSNLVEAQAQSHQGLHYRFAEVLGEITLQKDTSLAILSTLCELYSESPKTLEALATGLNLSKKEDRSIFNNRLKEVCISLSDIIKKEREVIATKTIIDSKSRVLAFCEDSNGINPERFVKCMQSKGISEDRILAFKNRNSNLLEEQKECIEKSVSNPNEKSLIYIWGHGDQLGSRAVDTNDLCTSIINGAKKSVDIKSSKEGFLSIDLSHVTVILDHCLSGQAANSFLRRLEDKSNLLGFKITKYPLVVGTSQQKEFSKGQDISLFLEVLESVPVKDNKLTGMDLLIATKSLNDHSSNLSATWQHSVNLADEYQRRVMLGSSTPLIYSREVSTFNQLIETINNSLKTINENSTKTLKLPKILNDTKIRLHLSESSIESKVFS